MDALKLKLAALPFDRQEFNYEMDAKFFAVAEPIEVRDAAVRARLEVVRRSDTVFEMHLHCEGTLTIPCDRCLGDLLLPVDTDYDFSVTHTGTDYDDDGEGRVTLPAGEPELDLEPIVRDTVLLAIPLTHSHDADECDGKVIDALARHSIDEEPVQESNPTEDVSADPRWDALKDILNENNN